MKTSKIFGVRRFTSYRVDGRCFELFKAKTGECASFPGTKKDLEAYAKKKNIAALAKLEREGN